MDAATLPLSESKGKGNSARNAGILWQPPFCFGHTRRQSLFYPPSWTHSDSQPAVADVGAVVFAFKKFSAPCALKRDTHNVKQLIFGEIVQRNWIQSLLSLFQANYSIFQRLIISRNILPLNTLTRQLTETISPRRLLKTVFVISLLQTYLEYSSSCIGLHALGIPGCDTVLRLVNSLKSACEKGLYLTCVHLRARTHTPSHTEDRGKRLMWQGLCSGG